MADFINALRINGVSLVDAVDGNVEELVGDGCGCAKVEVLLHVLAAVPGDVAKEHDGLKNEFFQRPI